MQMGEAPAQGPLRQIIEHCQPQPVDVAREFIHVVCFHMLMQFARSAQLVRHAGTEVVRDEVGLGQQAVEVELSSEVENSWMAADLSLVNEETGETFAAGLEVAYYHGVDGGESWSEGSRTKSLVIPQVPVGKYVLRIEPSWPVVPSCTTSIDCGPISYLATRTWTCNLGKCERSCSEYASDCGTGRSCLNGRCVIPAVPYKIKLAYPSARTGYAFWLWLFMAAVPLWSFFGFRSFEKRRADDNS
mgnify:CR=1 FL=1